MIYVDIPVAGSPFLPLCATSAPPLAAAGQLPSSLPPLLTSATARLTMSPQREQWQHSGPAGSRCIGTLAAAADARAVLRLRMCCTSTRWTMPLGGAAGVLLTPRDGSFASARITISKPETPCDASITQPQSQRAWQMAAGREYHYEVQ